MDSASHLDARPLRDRNGYAHGDEYTAVNGDCLCNVDPDSESNTIPNGDPHANCHRFINSLSNRNEYIRPS